MRGRRLVRENELRSLFGAGEFVGVGWLDMVRSFGCGFSAVIRRHARKTRYFPISSRYFSTWSAAIQPVPAAVTAWR